LERRGILITLEGLDGAGKSTQIRGLVKHLRSRGYAVIVTREPGGTRVGEQIRQILLADRVRSGIGKNRRGKVSPGPTPSVELALMYAARAQHLEEVVRPALAEGRVVVSDRFNDASLAYQGYGRKLGVAAVEVLDRIVCGRTQPDLTVLLDLSPRVALARARQREREGAGASGRGRFEAQSLKFHERVRAGYLAIARKEPGRVKIVRANRSVDEMQAEIRKLVDEFLSRRTKR
jgi:dTMP kinase